MKISQILSEKGRTLSFEIFPPKPNAKMDIHKIIRDIAALRPDFISVTYGAGGSTSKSTVEIAADIQNTYGIPALAHLTCLSSTRAHIAEFIGNLQTNHLENVLALRGDKPLDSQEPLPNHYQYAYQLIGDVRAKGPFCIGAACYPEGHVESPHKETDIDFLKQKVESGCDFLITQMFFDNDILYNFLYRILAKDIKIPVIAGVMPVLNIKQIKRACELSGTILPPRIKAFADRYGDHPAAMKQAGIAYATEQIVDLLANGVNHIHLYTMNRPDVAAQIVANISHLLEV